MFRKIKKIIFALFGLLVMFILLSPVTFESAAAQEKEGAQDALNESVMQQISALDLQALQEYLDSLDGYEGGNVGDRLLQYIGGESFDYGNFFAEIANVLFAKVKSLFPSFACIAAITLLCGIISSLNSQFVAQSTGQTVFFVAYAATLIPVLAILTECFSTTKATVTSLQTQMQAVFPVLLTLISASGGTVSAAIFQPAVAFLGNTIISLLSSVVLPLTVAIVAFSMAGHLTKTIQLGKFTAFFKSINKWIFGISISVFGLFFTVQGITSVSYDGIAKKVTQYAIGTGVPIVGGFLSGGFDLAVAGSVLIKNSLGSMSIFLMISVLFDPVILLVCVNVLLRLTAALTQPFGEERISNFLTETAENVNYCTACVLVTAFLYFICIVLFVCSAEMFI